MIKSLGCSASGCDQPALLAYNHDIFSALTGPGESIFLGQLQPRHLLAGVPI